MKTNFLPVLTLAGIASLLPSAAAAQPPADPLSGEVTVKAVLFDQFDGVDADRTSFLERYRAQRGWSGDMRSGVYLDLDVDLKYQPDDKRTLTVKRWGEGQYRHGGQAQWDTEQFRLGATYDFFRRSSGGLDHYFSPNVVPGGTDPSYFPAGSTNTASGYAAQFNRDTDRTLYHVNRFDYGLGFSLKPGILGGGTTIAVNFDGYLRYGKRRLTYVLGGSDVQKAPVAPTNDFVLQRWRGMTQNVDENMNRVTWNLTTSPGKVVNLAYTGFTEGFDNRARDYRHRDIPLVAPYFYNPTADQDRPLGFNPDSSLTSHALRVNRTFGSTQVAAGYARTDLKQDTFTVPQTRFGFNVGKIKTQHANLDIDAGVTPAVTLQGHFRFGQRDNDSSFPVAGLLNAAESERLGTRLNRLEAVNYGLAAVFRPHGLGSSFALGWKGEDKSRDLTYHASGITQGVSNYRGDTDADELYARWSALNLRGLTLRLTSSYAWADRTGLVTEPSGALGLKAVLGYTAPSGTVFSSYYSLKDRENDLGRLTDKAVTAPITYQQDLSSTVQSAGAAVSCQPSKESSVHVGLDWTRLDASVLFFESSRRRFEATTSFALRDTVGSVVDHYLLAVGGDYAASKEVKLTWAYEWSKADGELASGYVARQLHAIDDTLDNVLHTLELGARWQLTKDRQLRVAYRYDNYDDAAYPVLSGGIHSLMVAVSLRL
ncbi:MAG: MtrB/PioB family outer membrane beta-barrel protein [Verrucomicrobia bacterium]|nr:MtrB/PioB family outer membrane beta-barrel protein [Verrucomicrobiota bacterium]